MPDIECLRDVPWETRNLGIASFEVAEAFIENPDETNLRRAIEEKVRQSEEIFVQARVAKQHYGTAAMLEEIGFRFIEATLTPYSGLRKNAVLEKFLSNRDDFAPPRYSPGDWTVVRVDKEDSGESSRLREIAAESFSDDRFHIDPRCGQAVADARFAFWVDDLLADDEVVFDTAKYRGSAQGFMARKANNLILAGFAKQYAARGIGEFLWLNVMADLLNEGHANTTTSISANNTAVLNLYARLGFKFKEPAITLHYWRMA